MLGDKTDIKAGTVTRQDAGIAGKTSSHFAPRIMSDASKIALIALCRFLQSANFGLLDCQVPNPHLRSMGAVEVSRQEFEERLRELVPEPGIPGRWTGMLDAKHRW